MFRQQAAKEQVNLIPSGNECKSLEPVQESSQDASEQKAKIPSLEENSYFESYLAVTLAKRRDLFPVVQKMANGIIWQIDHYRPYYKELLRQPKIFLDVHEALYCGDFGVLKGMNKRRDEILDDIKAMMQDSSKLLVNVIPLQFIFNYRLFCQIPEVNFYNVFTQFKAARKYLKQTKTHVWRKHEVDVVPTTQIGVSRFPEVCAKINALPETAEIMQAINIPNFKTSFERYRIYPGDMLHKFIKHNAPMVAGPSTHTLLTIASARTIAPFLTDEDIKEYAFAYFVFTGCAGYHTFHEVMSIVSKCLGRPYDMSNYVDNLPESVKNSDYIKDLRKLFPEQLRPASSVYTGKPAARYGQFYSSLPDIVSRVSRKDISFSIQDTKASEQKAGLSPHQR